MDKETCNKTWAGEVFGPNGSLARTRANYEAAFSPTEVRDATVGLVSQLYTAAKQCLTRWREYRWRLDLALWSARYILEARRLAHWVYFKHFGELTHNQLDVLGALFFRLGDMEKAHECYEAALYTIYDIEREEEGGKFKPHEKGLVLCGVAKCRFALGLNPGTVGFFFQDAKEIALGPACDHNQSVRILRAVGEYEATKGWRARAYDSLEEALKRAKEASLPDQTLQCEQALAEARAKLDCHSRHH